MPNPMTTERIGTNHGTNAPPESPAAAAPRRRWYRAGGMYAPGPSGTVTVGFMLLSMLMYAAVAGVWNTGIVVDEKIMAQRAADTAAFGAATHLSRTLNETAMMNMLILRSLAAEAVARDCLFTYVSGTVLSVAMVIYNCIIWNFADAALWASDLVMLQVWMGEFQPWGFRVWPVSYTHLRAHET